MIFFIPSRPFFEHVETLDMLFKRLTALGFTLSLQKSNFCCESVKFLGVIIDRFEVRADPEKLQTIQDFPRPKDRKQLQGFLDVWIFAALCDKTRGLYLSISKSIKRGHML